MIVFKPETVTKLHISINTKEDAILLRALANAAELYLDNKKFADPLIKLSPDDDSVEIQKIRHLIKDIFMVTFEHKYQFVN